MKSHLRRRNAAGQEQRSAVSAQSDVQLKPKHGAFTLDERDAPLAQLRHRELASKSGQAAQLHACARMMARRVGGAPVQRVEHELLQGKFAVAQREEDEDLTQGQLTPVQRAAKPNSTGLPDQLKSGMESLSGMSMDHVKVHYNSDKPAQLQAHAYAQGSEIHVAPGQERHLPHEAWHVVQQAQGRVKPTLQMKGNVAVNDDAGLEREADVMGAQAMRYTVMQARRMHSAFPSVAASAPLQLERARPLLANERDLLEDTKRVMEGTPRTRDENLLDTTYDNVADNLLLDVNMQYEEELQRTIEHDGFFKRALEKTVDVIHEFGGIRSVANTRSDDTSRAGREKTVIATIRRTPGNEHITTHRLEAGKFAPRLLAEAATPDVQHMNVGYLKLIKMLETQAPYFGGSVEYAKGVKDSFEYWVYHLSTLTKDPDRAYRPDEDGGRLPKPMKDYRTHKWGQVPLNNQRNLGTGIVEAQWSELPQSLRGKMREELNFVLTQLATQQFPDDRGARSAFYLRGGKALRLERLIRKHYPLKREPMTEISLEQLAIFWNNLDEDGKKELYGDVTHMPWSGAHLHDGEGWEQSQTHTELREEVDFRKLPYRVGSGLENVVGVRGNILELPQVASEKYRRELADKFPHGGGRIPLKTFTGSAEHMRKEYEEHTKAEYLRIEDLVAEFEEKHDHWFGMTKIMHKPIIGGISGHTLGYLNLYSEAQQRAEAFNDAWPDMEVVRTAMLGALIGDKRHHSYDEVMAASAGMPYRASYGMSRLHYFYSTSYLDVIQSRNPAIKAAATEAQQTTLHKALLILTGKNTVANLIMQVAGYDDEIYEMIKQIITVHCGAFGYPDRRALDSLNRRIKLKMRREGR